tara:strand:+ start:125 stop:646 length:522 start_codon:yes stop_codon:yes gene_type:complete
MSEMVCLGVIVGAHGINGLIRIKSFTETESDIVSYGTLKDGRGSDYDLVITGRAKGTLIAKVAGVSDRTGAEKLTGKELFIHRSNLPTAAKNEFYHADLLNLEVYKRSGMKIGVVIGVHNFGAGDLLDVALDGSVKTVLLPFNEGTVPEIDLCARKMIIEPMPGLLDDMSENQ